MQELGKKLVQAALQLHKRVRGTFRKTATNFHYEFNIRHMAGVFQGMLVAKPEQFKTSEKLVQLWLHESERVYGDRLVSVNDLAKYKELARRARPEVLQEMSPSPDSTRATLIFCHFAQGVGDKMYDRINEFSELSGCSGRARGVQRDQRRDGPRALRGRDAPRLPHLAHHRTPGGHALLVGVGGMGKQSLARSRRSSTATRLP